MTEARQVVLVTGATSGIGREAARRFAAAGFTVVGTGRRTSGLTPPRGVAYVDLDVASDESVTAAVRQVVDRFGRMDVLVKNAGIGAAGAVIFVDGVKGVEVVTAEFAAFFAAAQKWRVADNGITSGPSRGAAIGI